MDRPRFETLVEEAIASLPDRFREKLENVAVIVEDRPARRAARRHGGPGRLLLGLYQGRPLTARRFDDGAGLPDTITIFKANIEAICRSEDEIREEVRRTVLHEIAHHFGIDDERLHRLGY